MPVPCPIENILGISDPSLRVEQRAGEPRTVKLVPNIMAEGVVAAHSDSGSKHVGGEEMKGVRDEAARVQGEKAGVFIKYVRRVGQERILL